MNTSKLTIAALAAITAALGFAVVPALTTSQAFAQDCAGCGGGGHLRAETCEQTQSGDVVADDCPGQSQKSPNKDETTTIDAGKSGKPKYICDEDGVCTRV